MLGETNSQTRCEGNMGTPVAKTHFQNVGLKAMAAAETNLMSYG